MQHALSPAGQRFAVASICCAVAVSFAASNAVAGVVTTWIGPDGGAFDAPRNWSDGAPGAADTALFDVSGAITIGVSSAANVHRLLFRSGETTLLLDAPMLCASPSPSAPSITVADTIGGAASLSIVGGALLGTHVAIGQAFFAEGSLDVGPLAALVAGGAVGVGALGSGALTISGDLDAGGLEIGMLMAGYGEVDILGGDALVTGPILLANMGTGVLRVGEGGTLTATELVAALGIPGNATIEVADEGSELAVGGDLRLAHQGNASLEVSNGGQVWVGGNMITSYLIEDLMSGSKVTVIGDGSRVDITGNFHLSPGFGNSTVVVGRGGRVTVGGDLTRGGPASLVVINAQLTASESATSPMIDVMGTVPAQLVIDMTFPADDLPSGNLEFLILAAATITSPSVQLASLPGHIASWSIIDFGTRRALRVIVKRIGDLDGDGIVNGSDLGLLLASWGACPEGGGKCPADLNGDGAVDGADLGILLDNWTPTN